MGISIRFVKYVIVTHHEKVGVYVPGRGALCPVCQALEAITGHTAKWATIYKSDPPIRRYRCLDCGSTFKSTNEPEPELIGEDLPKEKRKKPTRKTGKLPRTIYREGQSS